MKIQTVIRCLPGRSLIATALMLTTIVSARADYQSTVLGDNPIAYFALDLTVDNAGTATDLSGNGNNSTYYNIYPTAGPTAYIPNAALFFGASIDSYVDLSTGRNPGILNFGGPITMEAWVQSTNTSQGPADIVGKGYDSSQDDDELCLRANGGVNYYGGTYNNINGGASASGGQQTTNWTYLVSTYDGTNWNLYVNSQLVGHGADAVGAINFSTPWAIGTGSADGASRFFQGNICQVALYTNALTPAQVLNHFCMGELGTSSASSIPIILTQPQPQTAVYGGTAIFTVQTVSALATTNQWFKNNVAIAGATNGTLTLNNVGVSDAVNYRVAVGNSNGTTNSVSVSLTVLAADSLKWNSGGTGGVWDTGVSASWLNLSNNTQTVFSNFDEVLFDDTVGVSNDVIVNGTVSPSLIVVDSSTNNYTFAQGSSPALSGSGGLVKEGSSILTIYTPAGLTGSVSVRGGTIYAGNNCLTSVSSITITNNSTLDFGGGAYSTGQPVTVSGAGVNGQGALYNSYDDYPGEVFAITLAGDTTFGGLNRWDLNSGSTITGPYKITVNWNDSADSYYGQWNGVAIAPNVGDIELAAGKLGILNMGTTIGNPAGSFIVDPGTELDIYTGDSGYAKNFHVLTNGLFQILAGFTAFNGNLTLEGGAQFTGIYGSSNQSLNGTFTLNGIAHFVLGDGNFIFTNVISGTGGFVWDAYNHEMFLQASNTYAGPTVIGGGLTLGLTNNGSISHSSLIFLGGATIDVSGRSDNTLALTSGQTLGGIGTISGDLIVPAGATISPAGTNVTLGMTEGSSSTGTITASNDVTLNGTTILKLNGSGVNDQIESGGTLAYGGTLDLVNISGAPYAVGNSFQIFNAASYTAGSYAITPATPGAGMAWDTSQLNTLGYLNVVSAPSQPVISSTTVSAGSLIFSGTGGTVNSSYAVLTSTNLATPIAGWMSIATNTFDGAGNFSATNAIVPGTPQLFYCIKQLP